MDNFLQELFQKQGGDYLFWLASGILKFAEKFLEWTGIKRFLSLRWLFFLSSWLSSRMIWQAARLSPAQRSQILQT